eukprot:TRINITY_DN8501_c0_g3_i1.p1 TRINITY_DN8501_c0_g3~~TRINITY_DN8501_c0_g3_i1.p1  ORF type:complete len:564 (+),score=38.13 TRINITY_DN8501_c0_g3_i1:38-1729(+)
MHHPPASASASRARPHPQSTMQHKNLLISSIIEYASVYHKDQEIVSLTENEGTYRSTYAKTHQRTKQLANALLSEFHVQPGDVIATLAWNTHRHLELYYAVSGIGAVLHTVNPRLFQEQIEYIINHGEAKLLFFDSAFLNNLLKMRPKLPAVRHYVHLTSRLYMPDRETDPLSSVCYEDLIHRHSNQFLWPQFDENWASSLCYTSGTTGLPKGVMYSHRSTLIHTLMSANTDTYALSRRDTLLVIVPLFHANAWGIPYAACMQGAKIVFNGPWSDGKTVFRLMQEEKVTMSLGVPTIWKNLIGYMETEMKARRGNLLPHLRKVIVGGSAVPEVQVRMFRDEFGARLIQIWGMTEMSPLGTINYDLSKPDMTLEEQTKVSLKQGRPVYGVEMKIVDEEGKELPRDGQSCGKILVRGPWVTDGYHKQGRITDPEGWLTTGDVGILDEDGILEITDREKDVIKSGGEWISSSAVENFIKSYPGVDDAAVVAVPHPKWEERPIALVVMRSGERASKEDILRFLEPLIVKWWMPDDVLFLQALPYQATGKVMKRELRDKFRDHLKAKL